MEDGLEVTGGGRHEIIRACARAAAEGSGEIGGCLCLLGLLKQKYHKLDGLNNTPLFLSSGD